MDKGLSRRQRILSPLLFKEAFDQNQKHHGHFFALWRRHGEDATQRLGVVASKRTFPRAVDRNRAKRLLREAFRLNRWRLTAPDDIILLARAPILDAKRQKVEKDLRRVFKNARLTTSATMSIDVAEVGEVVILKSNIPHGFKGDHLSD